MGRHFEPDHEALVNHNMLKVNEHSLWADVLKQPRTKVVTHETVSPQELETLLRVGKIAIYNALEEFYSKQYRELTPKGYTINRPSLWVAQLGTSRQTDGVNSQVYSEKGYANGGIHYNKDEQKEEFWPHWDAVGRAGFVPHVRGSDNGAWLALKTTDER